MYRVMADFGIRPWEFGELTYPWLMMIMEGNRKPSKSVDKRQIARSKELARKMAGMFSNQGDEIGSLS